MRPTIVVAVLSAVLAGCGAARQPSTGRAGEAARPSDGGAVVATVHLPDFANDVATGADGRAYVSVPSGKLVIVDAAHAAVAATVNVDGEPYAVAVTPDARRAYVVDLRGEAVAVVDTVAARQVDRVPTGTRRRPLRRPAATASRDGRRVYVTSPTRDHLFAIDPATSRIVDDLFLEFHPIDVAVRADGRYLFVVGCRLACTDGTLVILDAAHGTTARRMTLPFVPTGLVVTPDGRRAYVANGREASVNAIDLEALTVVGTIAVDPEPVGIAMDANGTAVYVTSFRAGTLSAIAVATDSVVATAAVGSTPRAVTISRDGTRAFVTHSTTTLSIVDLARLGR